MDHLSNWLWNQTHPSQHLLMLTFNLLGFFAVLWQQFDWFRVRLNCWVLTDDKWYCSLSMISGSMCSSLWSIRLLKTIANSIHLQLNTIKVMDWGLSKPGVVCVTCCVVVYPLSINVLWWVVLVFFNWWYLKGLKHPYCCLGNICGWGDYVGRWKLNTGALILGQLCTKWVQTASLLYDSSAHIGFLFQIPHPSLFP